MLIVVFILYLTNNPFAAIQQSINPYQKVTQMKKIFATGIVIFGVCVVCLSQQVKPTPSGPFPNFVSASSSDWLEKAVFAVIGGVLGFISNYLLARRKEKRESKELSYELVIKDVITREESPVKDNISLIYRNQTVPNLSFISCTIKNTGNIVVKDEEIRFEFKHSDQLEILEDYIDPRPEPELGVSAISTGIVEFFERKYKIGHLVKDREVKFNFVVSAINPVLIIHDFNTVGDVKFNEASINKKKSQQEIIKSFLFVNLVLFALYPLAKSYLLSRVGADVLWSVVFLVLNLAFVKPLANILSEVIGRTGRKGSKDRGSYLFQGDNNVVINTSENGATHVDTMSVGDSK